MKVNSPTGKSSGSCPYAIGDFLFTKNSTAPSTRWPGTTWKQIIDSFLFGANSNIGTTAGAASINISHTHTTQDHTLTTDEMPIHTHNFNAVNDSAGLTTEVGRYPIRLYQDKKPNWTVNGAATQIINYAGGGVAHNHGNTGSSLSESQSIMPPHLRVYIWERTA